MGEHASSRRYTFVFVCQRGDLQIKSVLLAASLRRFLRCDYELIAAVPAPAEQWGMPRPATLDALRELGVRVEPIENQLDPRYPISNKIACLSVPTTADTMVFFDSDILCLREFGRNGHFGLPFNAKPADLQTFTTDDEVWREMYATAGVALPPLRMPATVSGEYGPPYFNAGVIAVRAGAGLGQAWIECARALRTHPTLAGNYLHLDQVSLTVAVHKLKLAYDALDERYNYPVHLKPINPVEVPYFAHYHWVTMLEREPALYHLVRSLVEEHPLIRPLFDMFPSWRTLIVDEPAPTATPRRSFAIGPASPPAALVITGIPRSGTSYLCNVLHRYSNCVVLNEPAEIFAPLAGEAVPWSLAVFYQQVRANVLAGRPIRNKLHNGQVAEDTLGHVNVREYTPHIENEDFALGTKNPLAYLARLDAIHRVLPHARLVVCVRDPFDTIASWKRSFPHLRDADLTDTPFGQPDASWLTARDRAALTAISETSDATLRRAMWWRFLAERILAHTGPIVLVNYARLVTQPRQVADEILHGFDAGQPREAIMPSEPRQNRDVLTEEDRQAIRAICSQSAASLGLN